MEENYLGDVVLIDVYNLMYRAFHGNKGDLMTSDGIPTNAIYTTLNMIKGLSKKFNLNIQYGAAIFDGKGGSFRDEIVADYKANRSPMPENLIPQVQPIKDGVAILGWPVLVGDGFEADDIIATLAIRAAKKGHNVYIVSGDKDFRQLLVHSNIFILDTMHNITYDKTRVIEKMEIEPSEVQLYLALIGDSADNIQGVDKVGPKTAVKWIKEYKTLEGIIENKDMIKGVVGENLRESIACGKLQQNYQLIALHCEVPLDITRKSISVKEVDPIAFEEFSKKYEFKSWLKNFIEQQEVKKINSNKP